MPVILVSFIMMLGSVRKRPISLLFVMYPLEMHRKPLRPMGIEKTYASVCEMLEEERPDFVDIITPPETHLELCSLVANYGIPVICQKPFGGNLDTAKEIVHLFNEKDLRLIVHENFRFQPWFREIKSHIDKGLLGDRLHTLNFRLRTGDGWQDDAYMNRQPYFRTMEKLFVYETGIHYIDTFRYLAGGVKKVYARLGRLNTNIKGEDLAWVHFEFANGALGLMDANRYNENTAKDPRYTFGEMLVEGNQGSIWLNTDGSLVHKPLGQPETVVDYERGKKGFAGDCVYAAQVALHRLFVAQQDSGIGRISVYKKSGNSRGHIHFKYRRNPCFTLIGKCEKRVSPIHLNYKLISKYRKQAPSRDCLFNSFHIEVPETRGN